MIVLRRVSPTLLSIATLLFWTVGVLLSACTAGLGWDIASILAGLALNLVWLGTTVAGATWCLRILLTRGTKMQWTLYLVALALVWPALKAGQVVHRELVRRCETDGNRIYDAIVEYETRHNRLPFQLDDLVGDTIDDIPLPKLIGASWGYWPGPVTYPPPDPDTHKAGNDISLWLWIGPRLGYRIQRFRGDRIEWYLHDGG